MICDATLEKYGRVCKTDPVFERCSDRLFTLCKSFLKVNDSWTPFPLYRCKLRSIKKSEMRLLRNLRSKVSNFELLEILIAAIKLMEANGPSRLRFVLPISTHVTILLGRLSILLLFAIMAQLCTARNM